MRVWYTYVLYTYIIICNQLYLNLMNLKVIAVFLHLVHFDVAMQ